MSLPMKARVAIRDTWTPESSPVQKAIKTLQDTIGRPVTCNPDWSVLHSALGTSYTDAGQFVNDVVGFVHAWCRAAEEVLEDGEAGESLCNDMLEAMEESHRDVRLMVEVLASDDAGSVLGSVGQAPETLWDRSRSAFVLYLPTGEPPHSPASSAIPLLRSQIMSAFSKDAAAPEPSDRDDWAEVSVPMHPAQHPAATTPSATADKAAVVEYLPDVNTLMRPDELLLRPPYHLHIHFSFKEIRIQCSHSPSLGFLEAYFKKWCRTNNRRTDKPPVVNVTLNQSPFGLGPVHDILTLAVPDMHHGGAPDLSLPIVLRLVEGELGYQRVYSDSSCWQYRRDTPLKRL